jgi:hypothetical protein
MVSQIPLARISQKERPMNGTWMFVWHDGKELYDEVAWIPSPCTLEMAGVLAKGKLDEDRHASRVCIAYSPDQIREVERAAVA